MYRIGIIGVPGAGKTSLCRAVTSACRRLEGLKRIELVSEYARRYISKHGPCEDIWEQYRIMEKQIEWEDSVPEDSTDIMITDSPVHLGFLYASELLTNRPKDIMVYNDIFKKLTKLNETQPRYDVIFRLPPIIEPVEDGVRSSLHFNKAWREESDQQLRFIFQMMFKPAAMFTIQSADMEERTKFIIDRLKYIVRL